jgi:hypothetical protein
VVAVLGKLIREGFIEAMPGVRDSARPSWEQLEGTATQKPLTEECLACLSNSPAFHMALVK